MVLKKGQEDVHTYFGISQGPGGTSVKESACQRELDVRSGFDPWIRKIPWRRAWQPTPVFLSGESHGQESQASYSPQGCTESDMNEATWHLAYKITLSNWIKFLMVIS